jgi:hypothetical protein
MEPSLFADENAPEWAFSKRKGVKKVDKVDKNSLKLIHYGKSYETKSS